MKPNYFWRAVLNWSRSRTIFERILAVNFAIIALMLSLGAATLFQLNHAIVIGQKIEQHPMTVSNAVLKIESQFTQLYSLLDIATDARSEKAIAQYNRQLTVLDPSIMGEIALIKTLYLGSPKVPEGLESRYQDWKEKSSDIFKSIAAHQSNETITLHMRSSSFSKGLITAHLVEINDFAQNMAGLLIADMKLERRDAILSITLCISTATLLALLLSVLVGKAIANPIRALQRVISELANGNFDVALPDISSRRFEAGAIAQAAAAFKADALEKMRLMEQAESARVKAEHANQAKSRFLAMMSHELRTPMNAILGSAQVLDAMALDSEVREHVETLTSGGETLTAILNDVLDLSKIEAGKLTVSTVDFDFKSLLQQTQALWASRAEDKALDLNFHIEDDLPQWIRSDETRLRQILFNLLSNAIKFTSSGSVDVDVRSIAGDGALASFEIAVRDTGIGIDAEKLRYLFNPFEQADGSITRRFGGTGLGLAISKELAGLLGGTLDVVSYKGTGSTFTLRFDAGIANAPKVRQAAKITDEIADRSLAILVAEDNGLNFKVLSALLKVFPYELVHAKDGAIALSMLEKRHFDVVLMDIQMPVLDGVSATKRLRATPGPNQLVPVIAMTANAMSGDRESYLAAGMTDYVAKPIDARRLYTAIARAGIQDKAAISEMLSGTEADAKGEAEQTACA